MSTFKRFLVDDTGVTAIEYSLIAAFIAAAVITGMTIIGDDVKATLKKAGDGLKSAM